MPDRPHIETLCAHAREDAPSVNRPLVAPIYQTSVWTLDSLEQCEAVYSGEQPGYIYARDAHPNHAALERAIAALEGAEECVAFASGMAAIAAVLTSLTRTGGRIVAARQLYGATSRLISEELGRFGVSSAWVDVTDLSAVAAALSDGADVLLAETLGNPLMQVAELPVLAELAHDAGARLVVDNTFATPVCCRPLEQGADVVIHSVTKFLSGHGDLILGAAAASADFAGGFRRAARLWGGIPHALESWLALRGITTLPLRVERSCANAAALAERLEKHPRVKVVHYPGLASSPRAGIARCVLSMPGPMLAFELEDGDAARRVLANLQRVRFAPSLGDAATTVSYPVATSHRGLPPEAVAAAGITPGLIRVSVGIDHVDDVWADFEQAIA
jgi:cystathionine beta-lyase/cystathionine gamma-synthase